MDTNNLSASESIESLCDLLDASVERHASRPLFFTKLDGTWVPSSYAEFARLVDAQRAYLYELGVRPGQRVGVIAGNSVEWAALAYAAYGLGAALVPMYESQNEADWEYIVRDSAIKLLYVGSLGIFDRTARFARSISTLEQVLMLTPFREGLAQLNAGASEPAPRRLNPARSDVAAILYTSGTTGEPKGVVLSHGNFLSNILFLKDIVLPKGSSEAQRTLCFLPWAHAFGHTVELHLVIAGGASMAIAESVERIVDNLREVKPTALIAVPAIFVRIYTRVQAQLAAKPRFVRSLFARGVALAKRRAAGETLSRTEVFILGLAARLIFSKVRARLGGRLESAVSGGAALSREVAEFMDAVGISVYEGYGLTETSPVATANVPGQRKPGSVGRPLEGVRIAIDTSVVSEAEQPAASEGPRVGEVVVYGPNVMHGYHNRPGDARVFTRDGGFRTGDLGYVDEDNFLFIRGRVKEQYKLTNGKYVVPSPLEERLKLSPFVVNAMVHGDGRPHNVALIVPDLGLLSEWARREGIDVADAAALMADSRVRAKIQSEVERLSASGVRKYERIGAFCLLAEDFTPENGLVTPSMKLRRERVCARYDHEIEALYAAPASEMSSHVESANQNNSASSSSSPPAPARADDRSASVSGSRR
jgi:long-chain acyl-CoA synthetase